MGKKDNPFDEIAVSIAEIKTDIQWIKESVAKLSGRLNSELDCINVRLTEIERWRYKLYGLMVILTAILAALGSKLANLW